MKVVFWSPLHGQTRATSNIIAVSLVTGILYKKKTLLTQTHFNFNNLEAPLVGSNSKDSPYSSFFLDVGLDALIRNFKATRLDEELIDNCCIYIPNTNLKLLPGTSKTNRDTFDYEVKTIAPTLFKEVEKKLDIVFIDSSPTNNELSMKLIDDADLTVVNLSQNMGIVDLYFRNYKQLINSKVFYLFGSYDNRSKYNMNNIRRKYRDITSANSGVIPYNTEYMDALADGKAVDFIRRYIKSDKHDSNYYFMKKTIRSTEKILKLAGMKLRKEKGL